VGADVPDEPEVRPRGRADRRNDQNGRDGRSARGGGAEAETRSRQECYDDLRAAAATEQTVTRRTAAEEQAGYEKWSETREEARSEYQRRWPAKDRPHVDKSGVEPGAWRGEGNRKLDAADNHRVKAACDQIFKLEEDKITPAMRAIESQDRDRHLVGLENRRKGLDRIKEKVADRIEEKNRTPEEAVSLIADTLRYTFQYEESRYSQGVSADIARMKEQGFKLIKLENSWKKEDYKGINSQWIDPETGQRLELQFHTRISFEAKQVTHDAYKQLRSGRPGESEKMELKDFQRKVSAEVPIPPGAADIPGYPKSGADARQDNLLRRHR
jgi:hypothetical protein